MNIAEQIKEWINSIEKDFYSGLSLLQKVCRNKVLLMNLSKKQTQNNLEKIHYELSKFLNIDYKPINEPGIIEMELAKPIATKPIEETDYDIKSLPDPVQKLFLQKRGFYLERNKLSQQVQDETKGQTVIPKSVQELVKSILELDEMIKSVDSKVEYYWRYGALPVDGKTPVDDHQKKNTLEDIRKKIKNQNTYVTKARQRFEKNPENLRYAEELQKKIYELKELHYQRDALSISTPADKLSDPA